MALNMSSITRKPVFGVSDTNQAVQSQEAFKNWNLNKGSIEIRLCRENKGPFVLRICKNRFSHDAAHISSPCSQLTH